jgi:hypothetical protein
LRIGNVKSISFNTPNKISIKKQIVTELPLTLQVPYFEKKGADKFNWDSLKSFWNKVKHFMTIKIKGKTLNLWGIYHGLVTLMCTALVMPLVCLFTLWSDLIGDGKVG